MVAPCIYTVGDARVACVVDCVLDSFTPQRLLPGWNEEDQQLAQRVGVAHFFSCRSE